MPRYDFACPACACIFEAKRAIEARDSAPCPGCGGPAPRQFDPKAVMINVPESLRYVRSDFQPRSTATQTSSYLEGKALDDHVGKLCAAQEERAKVPGFEQFFAKKNPDLDLNQPLTPAETREVKAALTGAPQHD